MAVELDIARVEAIRKRLEDAPAIAPDTVSRAEAVRMLAPAIARMQARGYSLPKVVAFLAAEGLSVTVAGLKGYLHDARGRSGRTARSTRPKRVAAKARGGGREAGEEAARVAGDATPAAEPECAPASAVALAGRPTDGRMTGGRKKDPEGTGEGAKTPVPTVDKNSPPIHATTAAHLPTRGGETKDGAGTPQWAFRPREDSDDL
jgi:hypothetical protein